MVAMTEAIDISQELLRRAVDGDQAALADLLSPYRSRLKRMVRIRLNPRLQGRVDDSDVVQDALLEASQRLGEYLNGPGMSFFLWLRHITGRKLIDVHRRHLGRQKRDPGLEVSLHRGAWPLASCTSLAEQLLGRLSSPSQAAIKAEMRQRVQDALNSLEPLDREVLAMRHFEQLSNVETATALGIGKSAASSRYLRALKRLKDILASIPGLLED
jgi:RNA polymerase sigma-70 factor (ECF subfamily)